MSRLLPFPSSDPVDAALAPLLEAARFTGAPGQIVLVQQDDGPVALVGVGARAELTAARVRTAFAAAGRALGHLPEVVVDLGTIADGPLPRPALDRAAAEGLVLGGYAFRKHRSAAAGVATEWVPVEPSEAWREGLEIARQVTLVRDVVNEPGNVMTPAALTDHLVALAAEHGLTAVVRDAAWLADQGAGGIIAIGQGSAQHPRMVELVHKGAGGDVDLCLVGKGVTYDTGGLSLKSPDQLISMNSDMAGVAVIAHAMTFLRHVAPSLHVRAFLPIVENMPGPDAIRPGDVVTARNGKTIEILNTDFEGRTILADALSFASERKPSLLIDVATLTYGATVALGPRMGALLGNDDGVPFVERAAASSGEPMWRLPMQDWMQPTIESRIADVKNFPYQPSARAITAAMFLREFVAPGLPWAHLDIAGPSWAFEQQELSGEGATGFGMRLLVDLFSDLAARTEPR
ncbi:leucyl aminopeptidase family protein [Microbacterium paludicola]|uniref:Probable cytosol aminopeptidase n=1 Tax=Microbacterium paludicola TaxID=300019 RepID=A0A4Y9FSA3_9MICO|nr:leucyl aminopeptidase family protein [Microbacterium paludicola]MBF0817175.1 leucyl aminopeptidase family protein [Microbacterium paludicola]TFU32103.1 leucyl aminopeptidase family protein [Microbacterium paludicola]